MELSKYSTSNKDEISPYYRLKALFVGSISVGKTSFVHLINHELPENDNESTIGLAFSTTQIQLEEYPLSNPKALPEFYWDEAKTNQNRKITKSTFENKNENKNENENLSPSQLVRLQLWDCAGSMRYRSFLNSYMRDVDICFLCFDLTNRESWEELNSWRNEVMKNSHPIFVIIGNKLDLLSKQNIKNIQSNNKSSTNDDNGIWANTQNTYNQAIKSFYSCVKEEEIKRQCEVWGDNTKYYLISCIEEGAHKKVKKILYDTILGYHEETLLFKHIGKDVPANVCLSTYTNKKLENLMLSGVNQTSNNRKCCYG
jgi:small GTP-binding protein